MIRLYVNENKSEINPRMINNRHAPFTLLNIF